MSVLTVKGPFPVLVKCWKKIFLRDYCSSGKSLSIHHPLSTQAVHVLHVIRRRKNRSLELSSVCKGFMVEENLRHEGTWHEDLRKAEDVQKWSTFAEFPAGAVCSSLHVQPKQSLSSSAQVLEENYFSANAETECLPWLRNCRWRCFHQMPTWSNSVKTNLLQIEANRQNLASGNCISLKSSTSIL